MNNTVILGIIATMTGISIICMGFESALDKKQDIAPNGSKYVTLSSDKQIEIYRLNNVTFAEDPKTPIQILVIKDKEPK